MISRVTGQYDRWVHMESNEPLIIKLQSHWKGYLARKAYKARQTFIKEHLPAIIKIQVRYFIKISFVRWQGFCGLIHSCAIRCMLLEITFWVMPLKYQRSFVVMIWRLLQQWVLTTVLKMYLVSKLSLAV